MTGITLHTSSPISSRPDGSSEQGITPQTAGPNAGNASGLPASTPATTTASASGPTPSQAARPGAAPPEPTGGVSSSRYIPPSPTRTQPLSGTQTSKGVSSPPPPQPGAVPQPPSAIHRPLNTYNPSPPQPGATPSANPYAASPTATTTTTSSYQRPPAPLQPHQQNPNLYQPTRAQPVGYTTSPTSNQTYQDLSHPPGYVQNTRTSFEDRSTHDTYTDPSKGGSLFGAFQNEGEGEGILNTAKGWAKVAGDTLAEGEKKLWDTINRNTK